MNDTPVSRATSSQQKASDPHTSAWVSANAGSGKTHVLASRVIRLLLEGTDPQKILCLTFTRAAAAEMSSRIFRTLGEWVTLDEDALIRSIHAVSGKAKFEPGELAHARRLFAQALETPGGLKVQTIHGFCESLLQRFPLEADVPPGFAVLEERIAQQTLLEARAMALARAAEEGAPLNPALKAVVAHLQPQEFDAVLSALLSRRRQIAAQGSISTVIDGIFATHALDTADTPETMIAEVLQALSDDGTYGALASALDGSGKTDQAAAGRIRRALGAADNQERFLALRDLFCTTAKAPTLRKDVVTKTFAKNNPELGDWIRDQQTLFDAGYAQYRAAVVCARTRDLLLIADAVIARYEDAKNRLGLLDYDDLIARTLDLFASASAPWVLYKLDGGLDHILVDEAQDTSPEQWQVICHLAEEFFAGTGGRDVARTVFAVGDEKQSIFSFQGADPAKFEEMRGYFKRHVAAAEAGFETVPMTVSFRTTSAILRAVDLVFEQPAAAKGLTQSGAPPPHQASRFGQPGLVEVWPTFKPDDREEPDHWAAPLDREPPDSPRLRLAERIAEQVQGWIGSEILASKNRPVEAGDILVLVRRRNTFVDALVREFKRRGVAVAGADRLVLTGHIAVKDLLALARFVLLPEDDLTLATVLKSPLLAKRDGSAFDDGDLFNLAYERPGSLWDAVRQVRDGSGDVAAAAAQLAGWRNRAGWQRPFEFFAQVLGTDNARRRFVERLGSETNDPIDEFLNLALAYEHQHVPSLQGFIDWIESAETEIKRDMEHGTDEVRIMTVHGAKGLEANIVILPDTCSVPDHTTDPKIMTLPGGLPVWPIARTFDTEPVAAARAAYRERQLEEYNRLLYVAMTRACDRLYVCGYETRKSRSADCWYDLILNALKPHATEHYDRQGDLVCHRLEEHASSEPEEDKSDASARPRPEEPPPWARVLSPPEQTGGRSLAPSRLDVTTDEAGETQIALQPQPVLSPLMAASEDRFRRGRLIHALLQHLPETDTELRGERAETFVARMAADLDTDARLEIARAALDVLEDPAHAALFGEGSRAEVPVSGRLPVTGPDGEPVVISGQVDRLVVTGSEVLIADFKTNRPAPLELDRVAEIYIRQLAAYRLALMSLFPGRNVRCFLLWTDGPKLMEVPPDRMDASLPVA